MRNNGTGNLPGMIISFSKTSVFQKLIETILQGSLKIPIGPVPRIHHRIGNNGNILMENPVILLLLDTTQDPPGLFLRSWFPTESPAVEIISMEKIEDRVSGFGIPIIIFREDDEEAFFFPEDGREKGLISDQIMKPLGWFWIEKIGEFRIFGTTGTLSAEGFKRSDPY